jgi:hypothetical protein
MNSQQAEEHLRVIRSLMEKATIYRAISAPTALVGGLASVAWGLLFHFLWRPADGAGGSRCGVAFIIGWGAVLAVTAAANTFLLLGDARRRGDRFISSGMKHALLAMLPPVACGAGLTAFFMRAGQPYWLPPVWMLCYALGLLATKGFSPRSIPFLGWAFFAAGFGALVILGLPGGEGAAPSAANLLMAATFGLFHLVYAALTWPRGAAGAE